MKLVKAKAIQVVRIMEIIDEAKRFLQQQGIDQWQNGYPDIECIQLDIQKEIGYVIKDGEDVVGYVCVDYAKETAYEKIEGSWHFELPYVVVHRLALDAKQRKKGRSEQVFQLIEQMSRQKGISYMRIDTDAANTKMRSVLKRLQFEYCGVVSFDNSEKNAYDKVF